jgi:hypothetical protein
MILVKKYEQLLIEKYKKNELSVDTRRAVKPGTFNLSTTVLRKAAIIRKGFCWEVSGGAFGLGKHR